jgi:acid phosphatase
MLVRHAASSLAIAAALAGFCACAPARADAPKGLGKVSHIVVLVLENRSFDNLFGEYPGADGIEAARKDRLGAQRDMAGALYEALPPPQGEGAFDVSDNAKQIRATAWPKLANQPFAIDAAFPQFDHARVQTRDLVHRFYTNRAQIHGGANDRFAALSDAGGLALGYYSKAVMERSHLWRLASENTLADRFFMGAFGGSFLNHIYLVCACGPTFPNPEPTYRSKLDAEGAPLPLKGKPGFLEDWRVTTAADGDIAINTIQSVYLNNGRQEALLPPQTQPTIGDRLSDKGVSWAWYSDGFDLAQSPDRSERETRYLERHVRFQWHHQPFAAFKRFDPSSLTGFPERLAHLRDGATLDADIATGRLPPVAFYKPSGVFNQHPGYANLEAADQRVAQVAAALDSSPMRESYVLVVTYDENGGFWDHAAPPMGTKAGARADFLGPGTRIPTIIVSPFARKGGVDHTEYDTGSILKMITERFALEPLPSKRVQAVNSLAKSLRLD